MNPDISSWMQDSHQMSFSSFDVGGLFGGGIISILQIAIYLFLGYCQYTLSKKMNIQYSWMAWVPILSGINLLWIAGKSLQKYIMLYILFFILIIAGPIMAMAIGGLWGLLSAVGFFGLLGLSLAVLDGVSRRTGHGFFWALGLLLFYIILFPTTALTYKPVMQTEDLRLAQD